MIPAALRSVLVFPLVCLGACGPVDAPKSESAGASSTAPGQTVYQRYCYGCHEYGAAGAPRVGDAAAWSSRAQQGREVLLEHTVAGYRGMPAMGRCRQCSKAELSAAIDYMLTRTRSVARGTSDG